MILSLRQANQNLNGIVVTEPFRRPSLLIVGLVQVKKELDLCSEKSNLVDLYKKVVLKQKAEL